MKSQELAIPFALLAELSTMFERDFDIEEVQALVDQFGYNTVARACKQTRFPMEDETPSSADQWAAADIETAQARRRKLNQYLADIRVRSTSDLQPVVEGQISTDEQHKLNLAVEAVMQQVLDHATGAWLSNPFQALINEFGLESVKRVAYEQMPPYESGPEFEGWEGEAQRRREVVNDYIYGLFRTWFKATN